jgi:hypothetical protein
MFYMVNVGGCIHAETTACCKVNYDFSAECPDDDNDKTSTMATLNVGYKTHT